jgi:V/A-type H+-transporting ATPase subunit E
MGKEEIIAKITSESKAIAENIISDARKRADEIISSAKKEAENLLNTEKKKAEELISVIKSRRVTVANLEVRKIILDAKQKAINEAFISAEESLTSLPKAKYTEIIFNMLKAEAKDGDTVTIAKKDKDIITKAFIKDASEKLGIKLTLNPDFGDFTGGIILSGTNYDKNLTFKVELDALREEIESEVYKILFGDVK